MPSLEEGVCGYKAGYVANSPLYGRPKILYTDHAPSLIKAAETPNWDEISNQVGAQGTDWRLTAKGCLWRNGVGGTSYLFRPAHPCARVETWRDT